MVSSQLDDLFDLADLRFWVHPPDDIRYEVDLTEFYLGGREDNLRSQSKRSWAGDFQGRRPIALELADTFRTTTPSSVLQSTMRASCRGLMRFLDTIDPDCAVKSFGELKDGMGRALALWVEEQGWSQGTYKQIKSLVDLARMIAGYTPLFWPTPARRGPIHNEDVDLQAFKKLYSALKKEAMSIKGMFREGERMALLGRDPRGVVGTPGSAEWRVPENHAWLVRHLTQDHIPSKSGFYLLKARGLNKANDTRTQKHDGPAYLAPKMTARGQQGIVGKLRWFHPTYHDTAVFLWLFLIGTGWNLATVVSIDISTREAWVEDHPHRSEFCVVHAFKHRSERHVFIPCLRKPEWHPYRILEYMIERTASLRRTVAKDLEAARAAHRRDGSDQSAAEVERLAALVQSPWLYHVVNKIGAVGAFDGEDSFHLNDIARSVCERHSLGDHHPILTQLTTSDARDAWIGHAYITSGNNALIAQLAAQHSDYRTLVHYLRRRRYRAQSEKAVRTLQKAVFSEIEGGRVLDGTRLRLLVDRGHIDEKTEARLLDHRKRSRLGMGCLDPTSPPPEIAPGLSPGALCPVQRCTGCYNGVIFEDSFDPLTRARAELFMIQRSMPLTAWIGSSFEMEAASLDQTLEHFPQERVGKAIDGWLDRFLSGEIDVHDTYPAF